MNLLEDPSYRVVEAPPASAGVAWLRAHVARFCEGENHVRRRGLAAALLGAIDLAELRRPGEPTANLAEALGLAGDVALVADVAAVSRSYQPHREQTEAADAAVARLVERCGGGWDEATAARIGLLVQAHEATGAMIAGRSPAVPATRRIAPWGEVVEVPLDDLPFGAGAHACPGRVHALALVDAALSRAQPSPAPHPRR